MFQRLLLAIDDSDTGPVAVSFAIAMASPRTAVQVVHVNQYQVGGRGLTVETRDEACRPVHAAGAELIAAGVAAAGCVCTATCLGGATRIPPGPDRGKPAPFVRAPPRRGRRLFGRGVRARV